MFCFCDSEAFVASFSCNTRVPSANESDALFLFTNFMETLLRISNTSTESFSWQTNNKRIRPSFARHTGRFTKKIPPLPPVYRKWRVRTKAGPLTASSSTMTSPSSSKTTSLSLLLKVSMYTGSTWTGPDGTGRAANSLNRRQKCSSLQCLLSTSTPSIRPLGEIPGCISVQFTRNRGELTWHTSRVLTSRPLRTRITGYYEVSLCCAISSRGDSLLCWLAQ